MQSDIRRYEPERLWMAFSLIMAAVLAAVSAAVSATVLVAVVVLNSRPVEVDTAEIVTDKSISSESSVRPGVGIVKKYDSKTDNSAKSNSSP